MGKDSLLMSNLNPLATIPLNDPDVAGSCLTQKIWTWCSNSNGVSVRTLRNGGAKKTKELISVFLIVPRLKINQKRS